MPTWPSPSSERLGTPKIPAIRFTRGTYFGASRFTYATACQVARPPLTDRTRSPRPQRAFTSRLPAVWSPSLPVGITTTWSGLLVLAGLSPAGMAASLAAPGRVEDWRAGLGRSLCSPLARSFVCECHTISTVPRFQPPPRRTQRADFPHCAPPFASRRGLWDLSCRGYFQPVASHSIAVEQP